MTPPHRDPIDEALAHLAGAWPGVAFAAEHQRTWRASIQDAIRARRLRPAAFLVAAKRYAERPEVIRPRLGEFLREAEEVEQGMRARDAVRAPPSRQIAPDGTPADQAKVREIIAGFRRQRKTPEAEALARENARRRKVAEDFRRA